MTSSPRSSPTSQRAVPSAPVEIGFAEVEDAVELHRFLCVFATLHPGVLKAPIDADDSIAGVLEVLHDGFAVTARANGELVGSLGVIFPTWWYNRKVRFMTERWFFVYPAFWHTGAAAKMAAEGQAIATQAGIPLIINGHQKRRGNGLEFTLPRTLGGGARRETH